MRRAAVALLALAICPGHAHSQSLGNHPAVHDKHGILQPWTSLGDAMRRELRWYARCPNDGAYPQFVTCTFMGGDFKPTRRRDMIPAMQHGMGIISYVKAYAWTGRKNPRLLAVARSMGDYLVKEASTPDSGKYPLFPRSTGKAGKLPQPDDCGCQADRPYEIEPDKGGIAGYALYLLGEATKEQRYLDRALHVARVLAANMRDGDAKHSPWPFRADFRTGEPRGDMSANMSYILRLFDKLIADGHAEFDGARGKLWHWIKDVQIPNAKKDGLLWTQFHEDYALETNRNAWSPLNLARYLVEERENLDPDWKADAKTLLDFVIANFASIRDGVPVCGEQDDDKDPWGGALSNYGGVLALYAAATGDARYKGLAHQALTYCIYAIDNDGCPGQIASRGHYRGGWQEDAHTDVLHNFMDAFRAYPEWGR